MANFTAAKKRHPIMFTTQQFTQIHSQSTYQRIGKHILIWIAYLLYHVITSGIYEEDMQKSLISESLSLIGKIPFTYLLIYYLIPQYLLKKKYLNFFLLFLTSLFIAGLINRGITYFIRYPLYYPTAVGSGYWKIKILFEMAAINSVAALGAIIKLFQYWYQNEQSKEHLAQEKLAAELKLLKSQIHPHFLFNTLNNLYALTLENSKQAPTVVLKLSSLLNYMLYECNIPLVPLEKELRYIENYISLEQLRYGNRLDLSWETGGDLEDQLIAPLILLPFIENSFKHGASQEAQHPWININIWVRDKHLTLQIENGRPPASSKVSDYQEGIGLKNVKQRLRLLYQNRYELIIRDEDTYLVVLRLELDSNTEN